MSKTFTNNPQNATQSLNYVWDTGMLIWVVETQPSGGGGGGGAVTIADGADTTQGAIADAKVVGDSAGTISAKLRGINTAVANIPPLGQAVSASSTPVVVASNQSPILVISL